MLEWIRFLLSAASMIAGLFLLCCGVAGVYKFRDPLCRMHAAAMNDTLGIMCCMLSLIIRMGISFVSVKFLLVIIFLWIASPVSSHLLAQLEYTTQPEAKKA